MSRPSLTPFIPPSYSAIVKIVMDGLSLLNEDVSVMFKEPEVSFGAILSEMNKLKRSKFPEKNFKRLVIEVQDFGTIDPKSTGICIVEKVITLTLKTCKTKLEKAQLKEKEYAAYKAKLQQVNIFGYHLLIKVVI